MRTTAITYTASTSAFVRSGLRSFPSYRPISIPPSFLLLLASRFSLLTSYFLHPISTNPHPRGPSPPRGPTNSAHLLQTFFRPFRQPVENRQLRPVSAPLSVLLPQPSTLHRGERTPPCSFGRRGYCRCSIALWAEIPAFVGSPPPRERTRTRTPELLSVPCPSSDSDSDLSDFQILIFDPPSCLFRRVDKSQVRDVNLSSCQRSM